MSLNNRKASIKREIHGNTLKTAGPYYVFMHRVGRARFSWVAHFTYQVIAAVNTHPDGFIAAPTPHMYPECTVA
jgi:hypothetical protein